MTCRYDPHRFAAPPEKGAKGGAEMEVHRMKNWKVWWKAAGIRAMKTVAQAALGVIGTSAAMGDVNWLLVGSSALLAGIVSMITSLAGLPEVQA